MKTGMIQVFELAEPWTKVSRESIGIHTDINFWANHILVGHLTLDNDEVCDALKSICGEEIAFITATGITRLKTPRTSCLIDSTGAILNYNEFRAGKVVDE